MSAVWVWAAGAAVALLLGPSPRWWRREFTGEGGAELSAVQAWVVWVVWWVLWPVTAVVAVRHALYRER